MNSDPLTRLRSASGRRSGPCRRSERARNGARRVPCLDRRAPEEGREPRREPASSACRRGPRMPRKSGAVRTKHGAEARHAAMSDDKTVSVRALYDAPTIAARVGELARELAAAQPKDLLAIAILKGSFVFAADLLRALHAAELHPHVEFLTLSSYRKSTVSAGGRRLPPGP